MIADLNPLAMRQLPLRKSALVTIDFIRASRGLSPAQIWRRMDHGEFMWVWNVTAGQTGGRASRELRFLAAELCEPAAFRKLALSQVINGLLGQRGAWLVSEVSAFLLTSNVMTYKLIQKGLLNEVTERNQKRITRESLAAFLKQRRIV